MSCDIRQRTVKAPLSLSSESGNRYVMTKIDFATRYPVAVVLKGIDTVELAEGILQMFLRVGLCGGRFKGSGGCGNKGFIYTYIYSQTKKRQVTENCESKCSDGLSLNKKFVECLSVETRGLCVAGEAGCLSSNPDQSWKR